MAPVGAEELSHSTLTLQGRHVHIQVHPVDALQLERHMMLQDFGSGPSGSTTASAVISSAGTACNSLRSPGATLRIMQDATGQREYNSSV